MIAHPPSECGDPAACPQHAEQAMKAWGCTCAWNPGEVEPVSYHSDCPNPAHAAAFVDWGAVIVRAPVVEADGEDPADAVVVLPEPESRARPATAAEIPTGAMTVGKRAKELGFAVTAHHARGPRLDQHWKVVETSDSLLLRGRHEDGRAFVAHWITKTGQRGKNAGVVQWKFDFAYTKSEGRCNATALSAYLARSD